MPDISRKDDARQRTGKRVVILGGGSTGEAFAAALRKLDGAARITLVERELLGGECSYWACMPSKALLRPAEVLAAARLAPGASEAITGEIDAERVFYHRDQVSEGLDDSSQEKWVRGLDVEIVRAAGRVVRPGVVEAGGSELDYDELVVATGSDAAIPPLPGLGDVDYWTNREATQTREIPESLVVLGGGVVGCELGQFFARMGADVTIVEMAPQLLPRNSPRAGELMQELFEDEGMTIRVGAAADRVASAGQGVLVHLANGEAVEAQRLLVATGRRPNTDGLGLEQLDVKLTGSGVSVSDRMYAGDKVWAIGDVNGIALFTHAGKYQARVAAVNIAGGEAHADHRAVPGTAFTDPQVASVGVIAGDGVVSSTWTGTARRSAYERPRRATFTTLYADPERGVL
ncbi:MAG: dihydrolipoyl dehydrogenase family protein, partial [Gaiellales bacterium]